MSPSSLSAAIPVVVAHPFSMRIQCSSWAGASFKPNKDCCSERYSDGFCVPRPDTDQNSNRLRSKRYNSITYDKQAYELMKIDVKVASMEAGVYVVSILSSLLPHGLNRLPQATLHSLLPPNFIPLPHSLLSCEGSRCHSPEILHAVGDQLRHMFHIIDSVCLPPRFSP